MSSTKIVETWLDSVHETCNPLTPPPEYVDAPHSHLWKRKRAMSLPANASGTTSHRGESPKRRRLDDAEDVEFAQSASQFGSESVLPLRDSNTFPPPASRTSSNPSRARSPTREMPIMLKSASPPVLTESLNGLREPPPGHVEYLGEYLAAGVDLHFIPQGLKHIIKNDPDVGHQITKPADFNPVDLRSDEELSETWRNVKTIFLNARDCKDGGRDENAWCNDVFLPLLGLAIQLYGKDRWWLQSVQSQSIDPRYLSYVTTRGPTDTRRKAIDRKTDYVLSYSHCHPSTSALYDQLREASMGDVGHTMDAFTKRTALFSGFEIKPASGDHTEAELQISIWSAASIRKKQELASLAQLLIEPAAMVEPVFTIVGHEHHVYYSYPLNSLVSGTSGVHVLGPDLGRFERLSTESVRGIFRLLRLYGNVLAYGIDEEDDRYWGGFLGKTLTRLAGMSEVNTSQSV